VYFLQEELALGFRLFCFGHVDRDLPADQAVEVFAGLPAQEEFAVAFVLLGGGVRFE
jgi:hypothetical protein